MADEKEFVLKIRAFTPETIPMKRLAEYMGELAILMGEQDAVHFVRLDEGSTHIVHRVEYEAVPKVEHRLRLVMDGNAPEDLMKAVSAIDKKLREDNADGELADAITGRNIIPFPGIKRLLAPVFGPLSQAGTLDGVVVRVGGRGESVPVMLQTREGYETHCFATRALAKELGKLLFADEIRCTGLGRWNRDQQGNWQLERFTITGFEALDGRSLPETLSELRAVEGAEWKTLDNVWADVSVFRICPVFP